MYPYPHFDRAHQEGRSGSITVSGEHTVYVNPDQAILSIGIVTKNENLEVAQKENNRISNRVIQSLMNNNVEKKDIQTSTYQIFPQYNYEDGKQVFSGYEVRHVLRVTVENIDSIGSIIDDAVKSGANRVENIQFINSSPEKTYRKALTAAYQKALEKALTLSNKSGQQLDPHPKSIIEHAGTPLVPLAPTAFVKAAEESTNLQPGQIGVTATVTAEFRTY
ncbi:SIMPL domain-containing protein [Rossellomorea aquimaris]|uniref:SIMPL domain-containing protein n=1 Tax=Rossellomorea aquimaris TaxID=189382 RepID=UPI001CD5DA5E|nr:SIMPL domain-containing protein [Rossellomorea aquimaris]MCA1056571.1 SIMPL domain-containing protein [Rossellomorea aquimaris]